MSARPGVFVLYLEFGDQLDAIYDDCEATGCIIIIIFNVPVLFMKMLLLIKHKICL